MGRPIPGCRAMSQVPPTDLPRMGRPLHLRSQKRAARARENAGGSRLVLLLIYCCLPSPMPATLASANVNRISGRGRAACPPAVVGPVSETSTKLTARVRLEVPDELLVLRDAEPVQSGLTV